MAQKIILRTTNTLLKLCGMAITEQDILNITRTIYVAPDQGNDTTGTGTRNKPYNTVERAWTARMVYGNASAVLIRIMGISKFPTTMTFDGTTGGSSNMETYIQGDVHTRYAVGATTLTFKNVGFVYCMGLGTWSSLVMDSTVFSNNVQFTNVRIQGTFTISGVTVGFNTVTSLGCVMEFNTMIGDHTKTSIFAQFSSIWFQQNVTLFIVRLINSGLRIFANRTVSITSQLLMQNHAEVGVEAGATLTIGSLNQYGGYITKHSTATITITIHNKFSEAASKYMLFEPGASGMSSVNVEDAIKEAALSGASAVFDYKKWYHDGDNGSDSNDGSLESPVQTVQKAVDLREADGAIWGEIIMMKPDLETGTVTLASNPTKTTRFTGLDRTNESAILNLVATDTRMEFMNMKILSTTLTQTLTNALRITAHDSLIGGVQTTINDTTQFIITLYDSELSTGASNFVFGNVSMFYGSTLVASGATCTFDRVLIYHRGVLECRAATTTIDTLRFLHGGLLIVEDAKTLEIDTQFDHKGVVIDDSQGGGTITVNAASWIENYGRVDGLTKVTLTQSQIQNLATTPITLVPAKGVNTLIEVVEYPIIVNNYNTAAFGLATALTLRYAGGTTYMLSSGLFIQATYKRVEKMYLGAIGELAINAAVEITADADATLGNAASTFDIYTRYRVLKV